MPDLLSTKTAIKKVLGLLSDAVGLTDTQTIENKTLGHLTKFRNSTAASATHVDVKPSYTTVSGSARVSQLRVHNVDDDTNFECLEILGFSTVGYYINVTKGGTGSLRDLRVQINGAGGFVIDAGGIVRMQDIITVLDNKQYLYNPAATFAYITRTSAIAANRDVTEPLLIANDTRVYQDHIQSLKGKTILGDKVADAAKTGAYTLTVDDSVVRADASGSAYTLTLPAAATAGAGRIYTILRTDVVLSTNALTIDANASELIDNNLVYYLWTGESIVLECDGTGWETIVRPTYAPVGSGFNRGSTANRRYIAGMQVWGTLLTATTGPTVNTLYAMPFIVSNTTKFDTIECEVTTLGSGSNLRMGVYYDNGNCYPGKLMYDTGNISAATTGAKSGTITSSLQVFQPGLYWLTYENSATVPLIRILPGAGYINVLGFASPFTATTPGYSYSVAHTVGALPDPYTASATIRSTASAAGSPVPAVGLRAI